MRIILVYQHFVVNGAGSSKPYDLAKYLSDAGHKVTVVCGRSSLAGTVTVPRSLVSWLKIDGFRVLCLGVKSGQQMSFLRRLWAFLAFTFLSMLAVCFLPRYDVLLASSTPLTVGLVGLVSRYVRRLPWVFEIRDLWPEVPFQAGFLRSKALFRISTFFEKWFYREAAVISAISQKMCRRLIERDVPADKVQFIPTGVDLSTFDVQPDEEFRRRNDLQGCFVAVYAGSHGRVNGLDYVVEAAGHLQSPDIRLVLIGAGAEKQRLIEKAEKSGVKDISLIFLPPVPRREVPGILKACDVMLMMNTSGPGMQYLMTNKFFDYLAAGRPIVANVRAELTDWILQTDCGILTDPDRPEDMARILQEMKDNPEKLRQMGRNGRRLAEDEFDRSALNRRWESVLRSSAFNR